MRAIILLLGLLALAGCDRQNPGNSQASGSVSSALPGAGLDRSQAGKPMPNVEFVGPDGETARLAEFRGEPLLVNLWATWCAPCVKELPTLDELNAVTHGTQVLALSQDMGDQSEVATFLKERGLGLSAYQDSKMDMSSALGVTILPTTVLYGSDGKEIWRFTGDMDWTGSEASKLLSEAR